MIRPQKQAFRHRPEDGIYGDCTRTCIAMLLGIDRDDVPHEHRAKSPEEYSVWKDQIGRDFGIFWITVGLPPQEGWELTNYFEWGLMTGQRQPFILGGLSKNNVNHSVVIDSEKRMHDPALDNSGIIGPCDDGHYWFEWLARPLERAA